MKNYVNRHSVFPDNPWGDGGAKRTAQISEILASHGVYEHLLAAAPVLGSLSKMSTFVGAVKTLASFPKRPSATRKLLGKFGREYPYWRDFFHVRRGQVFLWESTQLKHSNLFALAKKAGLKVVALPHNLESLVPTQRSFFTGKVAPYWFNEELEIFKACDAVFTISREEQWLLRMHGIDAEFLPYFPPQSVCDFLLKIRRQREERSRLCPEKKILLLGTVFNPPTRLGVINRIEAFSQGVGDLEAPVSLHIAGYGTDGLGDSIPTSEKIVLHGALDVAGLENLLVEVDAVLIHQNPTTGCLTKIPELLLAGVPVIANADAARTWHKSPGVFVYDSDQEMLEIIRGDLGTPSRPEPPVDHVGRFVDLLRTIGSCPQGC